MLDITQDSFVPNYMNVRAGGNIFPKIINWVTESPIVDDNMQFTITVLQRQMQPDWDWEFIPSLKVSDAMSADASSESEDIRDYVKDQYDDDSDITLETQWSFDEAIDAIYAQIDELKNRYH